MHIFSINMHGMINYVSQNWGGASLEIKRVLPWRFYFGRHETFSFRCLVNFLLVNCLIQSQMKLIAGVISLWLFWQKWNFIPGDKRSYKHNPKWNDMEGNIYTNVNKNDWLLLNGPFILNHSWNEINFIFTAMKSNVNRISYMVGWGFISGLM